ncbi:hypothetical protein CHARACLAT_027080, partial [Characodon lateralis]|nr:hypothetical protein [Characodon lateralis]
VNGKEEKLQLLRRPRGRQAGDREDAVRRFQSSRDTGKRGQEPQHPLAGRRSGGRGRPEENHHPGERGGHHSRHHHRLRHFRHADRCDSGGGLGGSVSGRVGGLRGLLHCGSALLRGAGDHHHEVRGGLCVHPGGVRLPAGFPQALDRAAHHPALLSVHRRLRVRHIPPEAPVPCVSGTGGRSQTGGLPLHPITDLRELLQREGDYQ